MVGAGDVGVCFGTEVDVADGTTVSTRLVVVTCSVGVLNGTTVSVGVAVSVGQQQSTSTLQSQRISGWVGQTTS